MLIYLFTTCFVLDRSGSNFDRLPRAPFSEQPGGCKDTMVGGKWVVMEVVEHVSGSTSS